MQVRLRVPKVIRVLQTERFQRGYDRYNGERALIRSKVSNLLRYQIENPAGFLRKFERLRDESIEIYRIKITDGDRLIFAIVNQEVVLVDVGPHEIMEDFLNLSNVKKRQVLSNLKEIPQSWSSEPSRSFKPWAETWESEGSHEGLRWLYEEELNESWLHYLDEQQELTKNTIYERIKHPGSFEFHLILGGAGTGKTVVLLNLALSLEEFGRNVVTVFNSSVLKYLNSGKQKVPGAHMNEQPGSVVLIDDPVDFATLKETVNRCKKVGARALVVTLDPFQWLERRVFEKFFYLLQEIEPEVHELFRCYRQSANVGKKALNFTSMILEKTSPFLIDSKVEEHLKLINPLREICIDKIEFVDEGGRFRLFETSLEEAFISEVQRVKGRIDLWKHWHPLLVVEEYPLHQMPTSWRNQLKGLNAITKSLGNLDQIRGCEFQEVFVLVSARTWEILQKGILGATSTEWKNSLSFHTLLTRPKDSLVIFLRG